MVVQNRGTLAQEYSSVNGMLYSVPYEYIKHKVNVQVTDTIIEIFYNHNRIASHGRLYGRKRQYNAVTEHTPTDHQKYLEWSGDRFVHAQ